MTTQVITGADYFTEGDTNHAFATVQRIADGKYAVLLFGEQYRPFHYDDKNGSKVYDRDFHDTIEEAEAWVKEIEKFVIEDPTLLTPAAVHQNAIIQSKQDRIEELEAELENTKLTLLKQSGG